MEGIDDLIPLIDGMKHWRVQVVNSQEKRRAYECTLWHNGNRVSSKAQSPRAAVLRSIDKLSLSKAERRELERNELADDEAVILKIADTEQ